MSVQTERVNCDLCGSSKSRVLPYGGYCVEGTVMNLEICGHCGLRFINPRPTQDFLHSLYSGRYFVEPLYWSGGLETGSYFDDTKKRGKYYGQVAADYHDLIGTCRKPPGRLLDVGCAGGFLMRELQKYGWQTQGVDVSKSATRFAREHLGLEVLTGTLNDADFPDKRFDVVVVKDVLEHVPSPRSLLAEVNRILTDNGVVVVEVPTEQSTTYQKMRNLRSWLMVQGLDRFPPKAHEFAPPHLYYFTLSALRKYSNSTGFNIARIAPKPVTSRRAGMNLRSKSLGKTLKNLTFLWCDCLDRTLGRGMETTVLLAKPRQNRGH